MSLYNIVSPLDQFEIRVFIGFISPFINITDINITTFTIYSIIVFIVIISISILTINNKKLIGSRWHTYNESMYDTVQSMVDNQIGGKLGGYYYPLIYTLFIFIFITNLISMIPYSFALTAHIIFIVSLSTIIWLGITITGLYIHGWSFFALFVPSGCPLILAPLLVLIELLSYMARAISLGLRLSANVLSGHLLLAILSSLIYNLMSLSIITFIIGFIPIIALLAIVSLEFAIGIIQSYVFTILTSSYIKDALYLH